VTRAGLGATSVTVRPHDEQPERHLADILDLLGAADLPDPVRAAAGRVFHRLATVEAAVHGATPDTVHFHEVGGVDAIVDIAGACLGLHTLGLDALVVSPIALGGGTARSAHGVLPVPVPAVLGLLAGTGLSSYGGGGEVGAQVELATPTGVAVVAEHASGSGPMPTLIVEATGSGAGARDLAGHPTLVRLVVGTGPDVGAAGDWLTVAANVDDLDPRLWPSVLDALLDAGAADAWLTPILMKKGRPAHTVTALVTREVAAAVREVLTVQTSTIGVRETAVGKHALDRSWIETDVAGQTVRVKLAHAGGRLRNVSPEYDDVAAAAAATGIPAKEVLGRALAAAYRAVDGVT
jgi:uncharacterized protein (TIGR00299 family) protein